MNKVYRDLDDIKESISELYRQRNVLVVVSMVLAMTTVILAVTLFH